MGKEEGTKNIVALNASLTAEQRKESARRAGIASGESRRKKRAMREVLCDMLAADVTEAEIKETLEAMGVQASQDAAICLAMIRKAKKGDVDASRWVRDTSGNKVAEGISIVQEDIPETKIDLSKLSTAELKRMVHRYESVEEENEGSILNEYLN